MRVIAGKYKGRRLNSVKGDNTRPTLDRVRENVFNLLSPSLAGARVLDLFAGTGAIGIEALSRGAADVVFCDQARDSVATVRANLAVVGENRRVMCSDYKQCIRALGSDRFDIIYLDPPYDFDPDLAAIAEVLARGGRIVYEHSAAKAVALPVRGLSVADERKYGVARITILERSDD